MLDCETDGFSPTTNSLLEVGALLVHDGKIQQELSLLVRPPQYHVPQFITRLTGIDDRLLKRHGVELSEGMDTLHQWLETYSHAQMPILGYNVAFDMRFVGHNLSQHGHKLSRPSYNLTPLARRKLQLPSYKLANVAQHLGIEQAQTHRALDDCKLTKAVSDILHSR